MADQFDWVIHLDETKAIEPVDVRIPPAEDDVPETFPTNFPDGSSFGVARVPGEMATRTIGFHVDDLDAAVDELRAKRIEVGEIGSNQLGRYIHFTAPDGRLYELVEKPA